MEGKLNRLNQLAINSEGFVFDPTTGDSFTLNPTGLFIINRLKLDMSIENIAEEMSEEFEESSETLSKDISDFIIHLRTYNLYK
jgi:hypothetical protein